MIYLTTRGAPAPHEMEKILADIEDPEKRRILAALLSSSIGVFEFEPRTNRAFWDDRVRDLWGIPQGETITYETVVGQVHKDDRKLHDQATANALDPDGDGQLDMTYRIIPRDGKPIRWVRAVAECIFSNGEAVRLIGTVQDVTSEHLAIEKNLQLINELEHRVKNMIATAIAVINMSRMGATDIDSYQQGITDRLLTMAASQDLLRRSEWGDVRFRSLQSDTVDSFLPPEQKRVLCHGPNVLVPSNNVVMMGMALHELMTNAVKYGALSVPNGQVDLTIYQNGSGTQMIWQESGLPSNGSDPDFNHSGLGTILLMQLLPREINGTAERDIQNGGLSYRLDIPHAWKAAP